MIKLAVYTVSILYLVTMQVHCTSASDPPPNIVIFYADDLGWMDLGIQGSQYYETPHIDRIGREGIRFTNAYANAANCAPSRACLMTGLYTPRHGVFTVGNSDRGDDTKRRLIPVENTTVLPPDLLTLPQFLRSQGYRTCMAGKWHLSDDPNPYGFDTNYGGHHAGSPRSYFSPYRNPALSDGPMGEHLPHRLAKEVSGFIQQNHDQPFFVYLPFYSVHTPIQAREDLKTKYEDKAKTTYHNKPAYAAMIEAMDLAVGQVLQHLETEELLQRTLVFFTSDNGAHGGQTLSRPLRGSKGMFYEGGIRVPLLVRWPGHIEPGSISHKPVIGSDLFPTLVDIVHSEGELSNVYDGVSIAPLLTGGKIKERALFWHFPAYLQSYQGDRAGEDSHDRPYFRTTPCSVIRQGDWKLMKFYEQGDVELYNLANDIGELQNLVGEGLAEEKHLMERLDQWLDETQAPIRFTRNPEYVE